LRDAVDPVVPLWSGEALHRLVAELYPIARSITGPGVRETLARLRKHVPLVVGAVPSGTQVFDWSVPPEWTLREAWIRNCSGETVVDLRQHSLHVVGYSAPVRARMDLEALRPHLHSDPEHHDWIPYRTSYYRETWGFCLAHRALEALEGGSYEVCIDADLAPGVLNWGELVLPGDSEEEVLVSAHVCHPSLANDNLSGIAVATALAQRLASVRRRHTFRFLFLPATIGAISWLALNESRLGQIRHGLVLSNLGDAGKMHYKESRRGDASIDRVVRHVLARDGVPHSVLPFSPYGYDERQYCSPGIDLPVGCLMRTPHGEFPEYHSSADNLDFVRPEALEASLETLWSIVRVLEADRCYRNLAPKGEPQLGRRGLYDALGGRSDTRVRQMAMLWVLNMSDGGHGLVDIAERSGLDVLLLAEVAETLRAHGLLGFA
jgi:aminopeptidase-like protein